MLKKVLLLVVVFISLLVVSTKITYARWDNLQINDQKIVLVGDWDFIPQWNSNTNFFKNDKVLYEGIIYIAKKDNINILPTVNKYWKVFK